MKNCSEWNWEKKAKLTKMEYLNLIIEFIKLDITNEYQTFFMPNRFSD